MAEYTIKELAEMFDKSPQAIYKLKDKNKELKRAMVEEGRRLKDNRVLYGERTFNALLSAWGKTVEKVAEPVQPAAEKPGADRLNNHGDEVDKVCKVETAVEKQDDVVSLLKEQIEYLKTQLKTEQEARENDKNNYIKLLEEAHSANHEMRVLLLKDKEQIALLEETKKPFFKRLKDKLVKKE